MASPQDMNLGGSEYGPALAVYNDEIYAAWKGAGADWLWWSKVSFSDPASWQSANWSPKQQIPGTASKYGPSLAVHNDLLWAAWRGTPDMGIYTTFFNVAGWFTQMQVPNVGTAVGPSLADDNGTLYMAWRGIDELGGVDDQAIWYTHSPDPPAAPGSGTPWAAQDVIPWTGSMWGPQLAAFGAAGLKAMWRGIGDGPADATMWWTQGWPTASGFHWEPQSHFVAPDGTFPYCGEGGPGIAIDTGRSPARMWALWGGADDLTLNSAYLDFSTWTWSSPAVVENAVTTWRPSLVNYRGAWFAAWGRNDGNNSSMYWTALPELAST